MARLGQPRWGATITEPNGRTIWQSGDDWSKWSFNRSLCELSEGQITLPADPALADRVEPWLHLLTFWAGEEPAWHGVVTHVSSTGESLLVKAADGMAFLTRRRLPSGRTWDQADAAQVMAQVVVDGMSVGDPLRIADNLQALDSRIWVVIDETANSVMVDDVIDTLTEAGLEWTFFAGALLIGPIMSRYRTATLTDKDLTGNITVTKEGKDVVTDALVTGEGVWGQRAIDDDRIVLQAIVKGDKLVTAQECETRAEAVLAEQGVSPVTVDLGESELSADTPISIGELVPGVIVPVSSTRTGIRVGLDLRLDEVKVEDGKVSVTLGTPGPSWESRQEFPPAKVFDNQSPWVREQNDKNAQASGVDKSYDSEWARPGIPL